MTLTYRGLGLFVVIVAGCDQYKEPPPPRDVRPMSSRTRGLSQSGIDYSGTGMGKMQRSGMSGTNSDSNDDNAMGMQIGSPDPQVGGEGTTSFGPTQTVTDIGPGRGSTNPASDLDAPEMRNGQRGGQIFKPSDHYYVNGVDVGPSVDSAPGTGGPAKLKQKQPWTPGGATLGSNGFVSPGVPPRR